MPVHRAAFPAHIPHHARVAGHPGLAASVLLVLPLLIALGKVRVGFELQSVSHSLSKILRRRGTTSPSLAPQGQGGGILLGKAADKGCVDGSFLVRQVAQA